MAKAPVHDGEWFKLGNGWRQICCSCGLSHDHEVKRVKGEVWIRVLVNPQATANARRPLKKRVVIVEEGE